MRKLVIALALTSAAFAGSTAYFAHQLSLERDRSAALTPAVVPAPHPGLAPAPDASRPPPMRPMPGGATSTEAVSVQSSDLSEAEIRKMQAEYSQRFLAELANPDRREELLAERKMMVRNSLPRVDRVIGLTPEEYARFIELSAKQQLDMQEAGARCMADRDCQMREFDQVNVSAESREINELLGPERAQKFEQYKNTMGERESVAQLRNRLPDDQRLSNETAESLIKSLADERQSIYQEAAQHGADVSGFGFGAGMIFTGGSGGDFETTFEAARQNSQRLRDRAAQVLNAEQMRAFNEMQDETLLSLRSVLRNKDGNILTNVGVSGATN
jgi:hypothetical protein